MSFPFQGRPSRLITGNAFSQTVESTHFRVHMNSSGHQSNSALKSWVWNGSFLVTEVGSVHGHGIEIVVVKLELQLRLSWGAGSHRRVGAGRLAVAHDRTRFVKVGELRVVLGQPLQLGNTLGLSMS